MPPPDSIYFHELASIPIMHKLQSHQRAARKSKSDNPGGVLQKMQFSIAAQNAPIIQYQIGSGFFIFVLGRPCVIH